MPLTARPLRSAPGAGTVPSVRRAILFAVYIRAVALPPQLADDPCLRIEAMDSEPTDGEVIDLKPERIQEPTGSVVTPPSAASTVAPPTRKRG